MNRDYINYVSAVMRKAVADIVPFDETYVATDWSSCKHLPAFDASNRAKPVVSICRWKRNRFNRPLSSPLFVYVLCV